MRHARLLSRAAIVLASAAMFGACADSAPVSGPRLIDGVNSPLRASGQPTPGDLVIFNATPRTAQGELVEVCKDYSGGGAKPAVTFDVSVTGSQNTSFQVVLNNGECQEIWYNEIPAGETPPTPHDVVTITEQVPAGYTASYVRTSRASGVMTVDPSVVGNSVAGDVYSSHGYLAEFTNTEDVVVVDPVDGRMTGGGWQENVGGFSKVSHAFTLHCDITLSNNIEINWPGNKFHIIKPITSAMCIDDPAYDEGSPDAPLDTFTGTADGKLNGVAGATIAFTFIDNGEPGKNTDLAGFTITDVSGNVVLDVPLTVIDGGNNQAHYDQPHKK
ncbi:MAG TPA: hypothetical protein VFG84_12225 [Gemmatimonadaceae bacterium]|nr:hypothetical protein [Gemmatimonadaceae bacterium]